MIVQSYFGKEVENCKKRTFFRGKDLQYLGQNACRELYQKVHSLLQKSCQAMMFIKKIT